jgi:hypothetical protein
LPAKSRRFKADTTTPHGKLLLTVLGGLAEFERELIRARTDDGRKRAKARGVKFGRPVKLTAHQRQEALQRLANGAVQADLARSYGVSEATISRLAAASPFEHGVAGWSDKRPQNLEYPDPVKDGLVASLNRPGGNVTGVSRMSFALGPKRLELLHELVPKATAIAFLVNPANPVAPSQIEEIRQPTRSLGLQVHVLEANSERQIEIAFETLMQKPVGALLLANDTYLSGRRELFIALAARHAVPVMYPSRESVTAGGLMSYDASAEDSFRQVGTLMFFHRRQTASVLQLTICCRPVTGRWDS